jgi:hypothetical protein
MQRSAFLLATTLFAATAAAQLSVVVPNGNATVEGNSNNAFPFTSGTVTTYGVRIQQMYDSSNFTAQGVAGPVLLTGVRLRANATATSWGGGTFNNCTVKCSTAPIDYTAISANWAANEGATVTVFQGPVAFLPGVGNGAGVPGPWVVDIPFATSFPYDPSTGDLVIDFDNPTGSWSGAGTTALDVQTTGSAGSRVFSSTLYPNPNGITNPHALVMEFRYSPVGSGSVIATNTALGAGCIREFTSFYENFATAAAFDLANSAISMLFTGSGYTVLPGITQYVPPTTAATTVVLGDDASTSVTLSTPFPYAGGTTTALSVCSNGFVSVNAAGNGTSFTPAPGTMLGATYTGWWNQHDYNPAAAGSGSVKFEEAGGIAFVTWDGVFSYGTTTPDTFQMQFDTATGNVHLCWGAMGLGGTSGYLVGFSPGGPSADPGNRDLSAAVPAVFVTSAVDVLPLALTAATRPITGANWNLNVTSVPATGLIGVDVFGVSDPGINDLGFLGAPGCGLRASIDVTLGWAVAGPTHAYSLPIPNSPALVNFNLYTTSAVFQVPAVNAFGAITSNGINGKIGDF